MLASNSSFYQFQNFTDQIYKVFQTRKILPKNFTDLNINWYFLKLKKKYHSNLPALFKVKNQNGKINMFFGKNSGILAVVRRRRRNSKKKHITLSPILFSVQRIHFFFVMFRISEKMSYEKLAIFFVNLPSPALLRQNHATFQQMTECSVAAINELN